jgi:hypothetical protein
MGLGLGIASPAVGQTPAVSPGFERVDRPPRLLEPEALATRLDREAEAGSLVGVVELWLEIGSDGRVRTIRLGRSAEPTLDAVARRLARETRWIPAEAGGRPVDAWVLQTLGFPSSTHPLRTERPEVVELDDPHVRLTRTRGYGRFAVAGKVVSAESGEPLRGVQVFFVGTSYGTLTDANGGFSLRGDEPGAADLRFRLVGLRAACVGVRLAAEDMPSLLIALEESTDRDVGSECVALEADGVP